MKTLNPVVPAVVLLFLSFSTAAACARPLSLQPEKGKWTREGGVYTSSDPRAALAVEEVLAEGDFRFEVALTVDRLDRNAARIRIDENSEIGFDSPKAKSSQNPKIYVKGFLFGDRMQSLAPVRNFVTTGTPFLLEITRRKDQLSIGIDGKNIYEIAYESGRPLGRIRFEPVEGSLSVGEAKLLHGRTAAADSYTPPTRVVHPMPAEQTNIYSRGEGGYHTYRIPALTVTSSGTLLAFCEGRRNSGSDHGDIDLLLKRSRDGGSTWGAMTVVHGEPGEVTIGNPVPVVDRFTGKVWLLFCRNNQRVFATHSSDDGVTWGAPVEITDSVKRPDWGAWYATGPGHGICLESGRLVFPANHGMTLQSGNGGGRTTSAHAIYSDDHGQTWQIGADVGERTNEVTMAQRSDGVVVMNARSTDGSGCRAVAESRDQGHSWSGLHRNPALVDPVCQGSILSAQDRSGQTVFLFSNPASVRRERLTIHFSENEGRTWPHSRRVYEGSAAYSDLADLGNGTFGCLYERDRYDHLTFAWFTLDWVRSGKSGGGTYSD